jgi:hypothetical protein
MPGSPRKVVYWAWPTDCARDKAVFTFSSTRQPRGLVPLGPEAFEKARREDKPLLISIGYSTCHWCHVMERECFENPAIAAVMNRTWWRSKWTGKSGRTWIAFI